MKFSIWQLLLLTLLTAIYFVVRVEFRSALIVLPMCAGAYAAYRMNIRRPSLVRRIRSALPPTVALTIAFLLAELVLEITARFLASSGSTQPTTFPTVAIVCGILTLYAFIGLASGTLVAIVVHCCAMMINVVGLGTSAVVFQHHMRADQVLNPIPRPCPTCKTDLTRQLG